MARREEFKMERRELLDIVKPGAVFSVAEYSLPNSWYYVLGHAYAMSANFTSLDRIQSREGKVIEVLDTPKGYFVTVEFEEPAKEV